MRIKRTTIPAVPEFGFTGTLRSVLFIVVMLLATSSAFAQAHFEIIDGLRYLIDENAKTAMLVANPDEKYSGDIVVPEKVKAKDEIEYPVTAFGDNCFSSCSSLTSVTIPSSVATLGKSCFLNCSSLSSITIPSSVTSLGKSCFYNCSSLSSITIPSSVTSLGDYCFYGCSSLSSITIPSSVTSLGDDCFYGCSRLSSITIPSSVTSLGESCFSFCSSLGSITISSSVTSLGEYCFYGCSSLKSITVPSSVTSLGNCCFLYCSSLSSITIPSSVATLGMSCFSGCSSLSSITIPSSVTLLDYACFYKCSSLSSITIPSSVTSIGGACFDGCNKLESISFDGKMPKNTINSDIPTTCIFYVPNAYLQDYKNALGSKYQYIYARTDGTGEDKPTSQCDAPTITYAEGKLHFSSSTPEAAYHYTITDADMKNDAYSQDGIVALSAAYKISAYATADGYKPSDKSTATLYWLNANLENDPSTNINQAKTRGIVVTSQGGIVTVSGLNEGETVGFFAPDGKAVGTTKAVNGVASYAVTGSMTIVKIGNKSLKITVEQ